MIKITETFYNSEKVMFFFNETTDIDGNGVPIPRTVALPWDYVLGLNTLTDVKTKLNDIRLKMIFLEQNQSKRRKEAMVINNLSYEV